MNIKIIITLFILILSGSTTSLAQQPQHSLKWTTKKILEEHPEKKDNINNEQNVFINRPPHQPFITEIASLKAIIPDFQVNENSGANGADQQYPSISTDSNGNFVITWADKRNGDWDIYAQRYLIDGTASGTNFKVNDDQGSNNQQYPSICTDGNGNFVIMWEDYRSGYPDIYTQRYSSDGTTLGTNFKVNVDQGKTFQWFPSICSDCCGNFVITWEDFRNIDYDIYAQRYSSDGITIGNNFKVHNYQGAIDHRSPATCMDDSSNFMITWVDKRNGNWDIFVQRYSSDGSASGNSFKVNDDEGGAEQWAPSISTDDSGNFVITWEDKRNNWRSIYAQCYSNTGEALGTNFKVNDEQRIALEASPSISTDKSGNFLITWVGYSEIHGQRYSSDGTALGSNFKVTNSNKKDQSSPDVNLRNNRIYSTWVNNRASGTGDDIWANVLEWENPTGINDKELSQVPTVFSLKQNYPNPFNVSTKISYSIPTSYFVILDIYDMLGRKINNIVNEYQKAGTYTVNFDARKLSSGIYFYKLHVGNNFVETKKMMFLK